MNEKYIELYSDFGFKKILGTETNGELPLDLFEQIEPVTGLSRDKILKIIGSGKPLVQLIRK